MTVVADTKVGEVRLELSDISVNFGGVKALQNVSLQARAGQVTGLIGPNGAGKSTLLAVASGIQRPNSGTVRLEDQDVTGARPQVYAHARMARTFQAPQLVPDLDVRQHLVLALRSNDHKPGSALKSAFGKRITTDEFQKTEQLLAELGLAEVAANGASELPLGTRRLVEVAQCLACDSRTLLLDEPTAGLSRAETAVFSDLVVRVCHDRNIAVVIVEHDIDLVLDISSRVFVLDFGQLIDEGDPGHIRSSKKVQAAYLGTMEADLDV